MGSRGRRGGALLLTAALLLTVAACGGDDEDTVEFRREQSTFERPDEETTTTVDQTEGLDLDGVDDDDVDDAIILAALDELATFWDDSFGELSTRDFEPVSGGFFPYGPDRELPECGAPATYAELAQNAFYCPLNDIIAWDTDNLTGTLLEEFGPFSLVIVMAHEYGHAIQARAGFVGPTIAGEQQADCFAGAYTAFVDDGGSDVFNVAVEDLDRAVAGFLTLRDAPGTSITNPQAHGSAFDRVGAFQDGFQNGVERCDEYEQIFDDGGTTAIPLQFTSEEDFRTGGNAPFDPAERGNIFDLTFGSLETFWSEALPEVFGEEWSVLFPDQVVAFTEDDADSLPECPGTDITAEDAAGQAFTCFGDPDDPDDDFIAFDIDLAADQYERVGDFAVSGIISQQYSFVAQVLTGNTDNDQAAFLQADCFSGAWTGALTIATLQDNGQQLLSPDFDVAGEAQVVAISAGDLDEAVQSFLLLGEDSDPDVQGTVFERVGAFRNGFLNGLDAC